MNRSQTFALEAAKEITIAKVTGSTFDLNKLGGEQVADFLEAIYNRILTLAKENNE